MLNLILGAALMAQGTATAVAAPVTAPAPAAASAEAPAPQLRINPADLASCTALANTLAANSPGNDERAQLLQALALNWSVVFDTAQGQSQQKLRPMYDEAMTRYKTQLTNGASDETLGGVVLDLLNRNLQRCEGIRAQNADFFAYVLTQYVQDVQAKQAASAAAPAPVPAPPPASAPAKP